MKDIVILQVETTNICNAKCFFCPHEKFQEFGTMIDELWQKIITEASQLPNLKTLIPMLTGEPFCDKKIIDRIRFAREKLPTVSIELYTNGSLLTFEILQQLQTIPGFALSISLNGLNPETRDRVMKLKDWQHVVRMAKYTEQIKLASRVTMVAYPEIHPEEIQGFVKAGGMVIQYQSWAGQQYPHKRTRWTSCVRALSYMTIRYDGSVCLCCFDPFAKVNFGDLNKQTIEEIWNSDRHQEYIARHKEGKGNVLTLCEACTEG